MRRVAYRVEDTRVEQMTNYDRLILDVESDGSVTPAGALTSAGETLRDLFGLFAEVEEAGGPGGLAIGAGTAMGAMQPDLLRPIEDLDLSVRSYNCLKREGVQTVGDLVQKSEQDLLDIRNFGQKSIDEVRDKLAEMGMDTVRLRHVRLTGSTRPPGSAGSARPWPPVSTTDPTD